jgi:hypothetical protein
VESIRRSTVCALDRLRENVKLAQTFTPVSAEEMRALREPCRLTASDGRFELYKVSLALDNPQAREAHGFPIDPTQREVKELLDHAMGTDKPK